VDSRQGMVRQLRGGYWANNSPPYRISLLQNVTKGLRIGQILCIDDPVGSHAVPVP
jgi:hypothetical protein